ncbi:MAG: NAD-dependent epimerase/dehydratase family protein [Fluviicola sp.]|nr:NAD-dependent epimerase/dehydratase family protein [Fluviicola sp.]
MKKALVAGGTGLIGNTLVEQLIAHPEYDEIHCLVRKSGNWSNEKVKEHVVDFGQIADNFPKVDADCAFCCLGTTLKTAGSKDRQYQIDHDYVVDFAQYCFTMGIKRFIVISSIGASVETRNFYLRTKGDMERDCLAVGFESTIILRPSFLMGNRKEFRLGEKFAGIFMKGLGFLFIGKWRKYRGIHVNRIAERMIALSLAKQLPHTEIIASDKI